MGDQQYEPIGNAGANAPPPPAPVPMPALPGVEQNQYEVPQYPPTNALPPVSMQPPPPPTPDPKVSERKSKRSAKDVDKSPDLQVAPAVVEPNIEAIAPNQVEQKTTGEQKTEDQMLLKFGPPPPTKVKRRTCCQCCSVICCTILMITFGLLSLAFFIGLYLKTDELLALIPEAKKPKKA